MPSLARHALPALSFAVAFYAVAVYALWPLGALLHPDMRSAFVAHPYAVYAHVYGAAAALALGPLQFRPTWRRRWPRLHRWSGRVYLGFGVLVGGVAGLQLAVHAYGGVAARLGFAALALVWLASGWCAWRAIRRGDVAMHRRWMVRNFALTFAAVTLRLYLPAALAAGIAFELAYPVIAWLCWVPNLLLAEWQLRRPSAVA